jgi:subtilisin family serine protease
MTISQSQREVILGRPDVHAPPTERGREYLHRPGHLLAARDHAPHVDAHLHERRAAVHARSTVAGIVRFTLDPDHDVHGTATELARTGLKVSPNHVLMAEPVYVGSPGGPVRPSDKRLADLGPAEGQPGHGVVVGVVDTPEVHHRWLASRYRHPVHDLSRENHDSVIDQAHGHGTFVAGLVLQAAPGVEIAVAGVLDKDGVGDDFTIAKGLAQVGDADIVNLSLGGYTFNDLPPLATDTALSQLSTRTVVVCAAGNAKSDRPFWPAADYRFISVAALNPSTGRKAAFSNFGPWVRACAAGVRIHSSYPTYDGKLPGPGGRKLEFDEWAIWEGTSFATPHVAGRIAALMTLDGVGAPEAASRLLASGTRDPLVGVRID